MIRPLLAIALVCGARGGRDVSHAPDDGVVRMNGLLILVLVILALSSADRAMAAEAICSQPTTIFCEDWESVAPLPGQWTDGYVADDPKKIITTNPANVYAGSKALETIWDTQGAGSLSRWFRPDGQPFLPMTGYDHVFARYYVKLESGLTCSGNCPKLFVLYGNRIDAPYSGFGQAGICANGTNYFYAGTAQKQPPGRELSHYDYDADMPCTQPVGQNYGRAVLMSPLQTIPTNTWICIESEVQLNTPGVSNGTHRTWVNDVLAGERTGVRWRESTILNLNAFQLSFSGGVSPTARIWVDNIVVAQQRIGCATTTGGPPSRPDNVVIWPGVLFGR